MALLSGDGWLFFLRWFHFLAGITWIGMLYYFNFVQTPFFASAEAPVRSGMIVGGLVSRALWWFRWGAMLTFITGWLYILHKIAQFGGVREFLAQPYGLTILIGGLLAGGYVLIVLGKALGSADRPLVLKASPSRRRELIALTVALCAVVLGLVPLRSSELLQIGRPPSVGVAQQ